MPEVRRALLVLIQDAIAGVLSEDGHGSLAFAYDRDYAGPPLSPSMPLGEGPFGDRVVRPYLFGLLPDDRRTRLAMGRVHGVDRDKENLDRSRLSRKEISTTDRCQER